MSTGVRRSALWLMNDLVCANQNRLRHVYAQRFRRPEVDHELKLAWQLDRQVTGLRAFEDLVDILGGALEEVWEVGGVTEQGARFRKRAVRRHRRYAVLEPEFRECLATVKKRTGTRDD